MLVQAGGLSIYILAYRLLKQHEGYEPFPCTFLSIYILAYRLLKHIDLLSDPLYIESFNLHFGVSLIETNNSCCQNITSTLLSIYILAYRLLKLRSQERLLCRSNLSIYILAYRLLKLKFKRMIHKTEPLSIYILAYRLLKP